jgi:integrase
VNNPLAATPISPLRQRLIDDMNVRRFSSETKRNYIRDVGRFATFLGRSSDTATAEDLHRFQVEQREAGVPVPTMNSIVSALRFFFTMTLDRPDLSRRLVLARYQRKSPAVLSVEEVGRLLESAPGAKYKAILGAAYGAGLRVSEVAALKVDDIDSERMPIRVEQGKGGKDRNAMLSPQLLALLRLWWTEGKRRGVMLPHGWLFPGRTHGDQETGVAPYAAPQLRYPSAGTGCRYSRDSSSAGTQQTGHDRALRPRRDQDDSLGHQSSRTFGDADARRGARRLNRLARLT